MLSSDIAIFARALNVVFEELQCQDIEDVYLDALLVIITYSNMCFDNKSFSEHLRRTIDMTTTFVEYRKFLKNKTKDDVMIVCDAIQMILRKFESNIKGNQINKNDSQDAMISFLNTIKSEKPYKDMSQSKINNIAEDVFKNHN